MVRVLTLRAVDAFSIPRGLQTGFLYPKRIPRLEHVARGILDGVKFELLTTISNVETIAAGNGIHILGHLVRRFGKGNWLKRKGTASVLLEDGTIADAELHWFEAHGIGKRKMKLKRVLKEYE